MPKSKALRKRCKNRSKSMKRGGSFFPTVDNVIPYNNNLGTMGDPRDPGNIINARGLPAIKMGGRRSRSRKNTKRSRRVRQNKRMRSVVRGGGIFNYDLLTGETYNNNAVQSINSSSGTENTLHKVSGLPQSTGPNLAAKTMPDTALV